MSEFAPDAGFRKNRKLKDALLRHKAFSKEGFSERLFGLLFSGLVYPQIWEDPDLDMQAMELKPNHRIVTIGSNAGLAVPFAGIAVYAATKSAMESFTRGLARELGPRAITVNLVRPGPIDTDMNPADGPLAASILPSLSIPRYGKTREVAEAVAFLAGPGAAYVTGSGMLVDGGINA